MIACGALFTGLLSAAATAKNILCFTHSFGAWQMAT